MSIQVWKCEYCDAIFKTQDEADIHEQYCVYNSVNKHCESCYYQDYYDGYNYCMNKECPLYRENLEEYFNSYSKKAEPFFPCKYYKKEQL